MLAIVVEKSERITHLADARLLVAACEMYELLREIRARRRLYLGARRKRSGPSQA